MARVDRADGPLSMTPKPKTDMVIDVHSCPELEFSGARERGLHRLQVHTSHESARSSATQPKPTSHDAGIILITVPAPASCTLGIRAK
ncbi:Protein of unknown function [Pyronema omphalodes CBS 100304]|uniref:Uncharacterized protein n=1 Tax=Pyronema omphalodes (strain CBS 100304) TaxID=1076935 RepID=U4LKE4_PYROM|nr:Protein of unknown function [Pyronema omphalodes CBS 100304]